MQENNRVAPGANAAGSTQKKTVSTTPVTATTAPQAAASASTAAAQPAVQATTAPKTDHKHRVDCSCGESFRAFRVFENEDRFESRIVERKVHELPEGDILIRVQYSSLNYKDALSANGNRGVTRHYPHTPGIDAAGVVEDCNTDAFQIGEEVIVTSFDLGMNHDGGLAEYICVPQEWVVRKPAGLTLREAMAFGTAGFTAGLSVLRLLEAGQTPEMGPVLVTGAAGGVGSTAIQILNLLGFDVIAATSNIADSREVINQLNVVRHIDKSVTDDKSGRVLVRPMWAGAIDVVGGNILATALKACKYGGNVASCGNVFNGDLPTTVFPFILNGVNLLGIDSQNTPMEIRARVWDLLATDWKLPNSDQFTAECALDDVKVYLDRIYKKKGRGRVIVRI